MRAERFEVATVDRADAIRRFLVKSLTACAILVFVAAPLSCSETKSFEYAVPLNPHELTAPELNRALDLAQDAGVDTIEAGASWWYLQPIRTSGPGDQRWETLDRLISEAQRRDLKVNLQVSGTPEWVHPDLKRFVRDPDERIWHPPKGERQLGYFTDFLRTLVERYGSRVDRYEIWNEPNSYDFWEPAPDPAEYAAMLRSAYSSVKEADPNATVVFGGLSMNDIGYLRRYYEVSTKYPRAEQSDQFFDELNVHPYTPGKSPDWDTEEKIKDGAYGPIDRSFGGLRAMKDVMEQNGDSEKSIFIGEFGYSTSDTWMKAVPDYRRALYLKRAYIIARELPYVSGMSWYAYIPHSAIEAHWTLLDAKLSTSLTFRALRQVTGEEPSRASVKLLAPESSVSGTYLIRPALSGIRKEDASGWALYVDGELEGSPEQVPIKWDTRSVRDGVHSVMVAMYTKDGSVWPSSPTRFRVNNAG